MAYQAWSVVFGEQPSAAKWNILGTNDASFNDGTGIGAGVITSESLDATIASSAYLNATQTCNANTITKILLDTENYDVGSDFDTANSRFVAPVTGYYQINAQVGFIDLNAADDECLGIIYVNGTGYASAVTYAGLTGGDPLVNISTIAAVTSGQYIELYGRQDSANGENFSSDALVDKFRACRLDVSFVGV